ncbi:MAG: hypothetical protein V1899_09055 [Planctomycetota bacterium]
MTGKFLFTCFCCATLVMGSHIASAEQLRGDGMAEVEALMDRQTKELKKRTQAVQKIILTLKPIVRTIPDSLKLNNDGRTRQSYQLKDGILYVSEGVDFDQQLLFFHFDPSYPFSKALKDKEEEVRAYLSMKSLPPEMQKHVQNMAMRIKSVRTVADLELVQEFARYEQTLSGALALTPAQISTMRQGYEKRQKAFEDIWQAVKVRNKKNGDGKTNRDEKEEENIFRLYNEANTALKFLETDGVFFSAHQRLAMGYDNDPNAMPQRPHHIAKASASASSGENSHKRDTAEEARQQMQREAEEKARREGAKVRFTLKGRNTTFYGPQYTINTKDGKLWLYVKESPDKAGADCAVYLDAKDTWAAKKENWLKMWCPEAPKTPAEEKAAQSRKNLINNSTSDLAYQWRSQVDNLREKTGSVPADVQARLDTMIKETSESADAALAAYRAAEAKPGDEKQNRALFNAMRDALRCETRNDTLALRREFNDPEGTRDDLPWLLSMDQIDLINQGQSITGSGSSSSASNFGGSRTVSVSARPSGGKQYVGITSDGATADDVVGDVLSSARSYYHNHRLKLVVAPAGADKPVRGVIEGKSAEELFQSFARSTGLTLVKDEKDVNAWVMK